MRKISVFIILILMTFGVYAGETVRVGAFYFEPFIFTNDAKEVIGFFPDLLNKIAEEENFEIEFVKGSWAEGLERIEQGEIDMITSAAYTQARDSFMDYPETSCFTVWTQVYTKPSIKISNILELQRKNIGVMKDDFNANNFKEIIKKFGIDTTYTDYLSFDDMFQDLEDGKVDAGVAPNTVSYANENKYKMNKTEIYMNPFEIYFTLGEYKNKKLLYTINRYLKTWKSDKNSYYYERLDYWLGINGNKKTVIPKWIYMTLILVLILLLVFILMTIFLKEKNNKSNFILKDLNSELEKKVKEIELEKEKAINASKAKSLFLSNMSHEIRTPLNGIVGMLELMKMSEVTLEQKDYLYNMKISIDNLINIVNDILDISKIESGKIELDEFDFELEDFLGEILDSFSLNAYKKKIELLMYFEPDIPEFLYGDYGKLRQILTNLISNAIKFTESGEVFLSVKKKYHKGSGLTLEFKVKDTGIGIKEELKHSIFDSFVQGDLSYTKKYQGTGLGLAISKNFVNLLGGEINFKSISGIGTEFCFDVNLKKSENELQNCEKLDFKLKDVRILIIDDNYLNREISKKILEHEEAIITLAGSGREALTILNENFYYDVILLDIDMPEMDGFEILEEINLIRGDWKGSIIIFTSIDVRDKIKEMMLKGVAGYLMKPIKRKDLYKGIKNALNKKYFEKMEKELVDIKSFENEDTIKKVLLVEDNEMNIISSKKILELYNVKVNVARNGNEAVESWENGNYDIIFMDIQMPEKNGYEATIEIREKELKGDHITIIALTAYALSFDKEKIMKAGFDDYLVKPVKAEDFKKIIEKYNKD